MNTFLSILLVATLASTARAQVADHDPSDSASPAETTRTTAPSAPSPVQVADASPQIEGWRRPAGRRFQHGFRLGWMYVFNMGKPTREGGMSLAREFGLTSPNMMLIGYEGFYRIVGHSWLNVLMVGNVTVAGLEQSKFIPATSGLLGFEFNKRFQLGIGINLTPDPQMPTHTIIAAGWSPRLGAIYTPIHFFFIPDTEHNHRMGATIGTMW